MPLRPQAPTTPLSPVRATPAFPASLHLGGCIKIPFVKNCSKKSKGGGNPENRIYKEEGLSGCFGSLCGGPGTRLWYQRQTVPARDASLPAVPVHTLCDSAESEAAQPQAGHAAAAAACTKSNFSCP